MMATESSEGWKNYATWCVNEWLTQGESDYDTLMGLVNDPNLNRQQESGESKGNGGRDEPAVRCAFLMGVI